MGGGTDRLGSGPAIVGNVETNKKAIYRQFAGAKTDDGFETRQCNGGTGSALPVVGSRHAETSEDVTELRLRTPITKARNGNSCLTIDHKIPDESPYLKRHLLSEHSRRLRCGCYGAPWNKDRTHQEAQRKRRFKPQALLIDLDGKRNGRPT
jgi:hypothetical protein